MPASSRKLFGLFLLSRTAYKSAPTAVSIVAVVKSPSSLKPLPEKMRNERQIENMIAVFVFLLACDLKFFWTMYLNFLSFQLIVVKIVKMRDYRPGISKIEI